MSRYVNACGEDAVLRCGRPAASGGTLHLQGEADCCNSVSRLQRFTVNPKEAGTITMGVARLIQADNAHLRGFKVAPAGTPSPSS